MRIVDPQLELELLDDDRVLVRVLDFARFGLPMPLELTLDDAALLALSRRRVSLRYEEAWRRRNPGMELPS